MKIHIIAVGGSIMHNLALALAKEGHNISGSDDAIFEPSLSRLKNAGLLPNELGWNEKNIKSDLDLVILGMHAKNDNPELLKAKDLNLKIVSFPEFIRQKSDQKQRVVIAGSHGKTTITSMIAHVLRNLNMDFDYLIGAKLPEFELMVKFSENANIMLIEGDEYLTSPIDPQPKFMHYDPHILVISGIAWDHINVFPTEEDYNSQFVKLLNKLSKASMVIYNDQDKTVKSLVKKTITNESIYLFPYSVSAMNLMGIQTTVVAPTLTFKMKEGVSEIKISGERTKLKIYGKHNYSNIAAAWNVCKLLGVTLLEFIKHISTFEGAANRLQTYYEDSKVIIIRDFAHAPSKVEASVEAVLKNYSKHNVVACLELHTYSSLNKKFLNQYKKTLKNVKNKIVFIDEEALKIKNMPSISENEVKDAFEDKNIIFCKNITELKNKLQSLKSGITAYLMMSSGSFSNLDLNYLK